MGPNAIIQMGTALEAALGAGTARTLFGLAGLAPYLAAPPEHMVAESEVMRLHAVLRRTLAAPTALEVARNAGHATGDYLLRHRIPPAAQRLLRRLPRRAASRLLVAAIRRHAWTFAGSGRLRALHGPPPVFVMEGCALCRDAHSPVPVCGYYAATFERLFRVLVEPKATVIETDCAASGAATCRFEVRWG